jgi:hypothetical protein
LPLFGYRRKAYLIIANAAAAGAYCWVTQITAPGELVFVLLVTAYAMAISSTLCGAILVENGQRLGASDAFVNQQWLWFNIAALASGFIGGQLVERLSPVAALHGAAAIIAVPPLAVVFTAWVLISEPKSRIDLSEMKRTFASLLGAFRLRVVADRGVSFSLLPEPGVGHAALLPHDRRAEILAGIHRRARFDQLRRVDHRRIAVPQVFERDHRTLTAQLEHLPRHFDDSGLSIALGSGDGGRHQLLQRVRRDDRVRRDLDAGG